jgi:hypothetical protein
MPSPFRGMNPYLETPDIWPDFHGALAAQLRADLNGLLPAPCYARLEVRSEIGAVEPDETANRIVSDVTVSVRVDPTRHSFVEIRDPSQGHQLITLIEIVSPSNKRPGADRRAYLQKQREVLDSNASLIELDLLRSGDRLLPYPDLDEAIGQWEPAADYLVLVNRAWRRVGAAMDYDLFPIRFAEPLPCILVPLREGQEEVRLDLQQAFDHAYDAGPYRRGAVNYAAPPVPPLEGEAAARAEAMLRDPARIAPG